MRRPTVVVSSLQPTSGEPGPKVVAPPRAVAGTGQRVNLLAAPAPAPAPAPERRRAGDLVALLMSDPMAADPGDPPFPTSESLTAPDSPAQGQPAEPLPDNPQPAGLAEQTDPGGQTARTDAALSAPITQRQAAPSAATSTPPVASGADLLPTVAVDTPIIEGTDLGNLNCVFTGLGMVEMSPGALHLSPTAATGAFRLDAEPYDTHAALVRGAAPIADGAYQLEITLTTIVQLRAPDPAAGWERGWVLFDYQDSLNFGYLILKADGWELGRSTAGVQSFDATGTDVSFPVGQSDQVLITRTLNTVRVQVNGAVLVEQTTGTRPALPVSAVYTEDAHVSVSHWVISTLFPRSAAPVGSAPVANPSRVAAPQSA